MMREQIERRLEELTKELETGRAELDKVDQRRTYLREMVLRISGAKQILEELLAEQRVENNGGGKPQCAFPQVDSAHSP
jgi:hypothetical protein